jgi:hypothetical protein
VISFKQFLIESATIGKKIGGDHYVHKDYEHVLPKDDLENAKKHLPAGHEYTVVKHNKKEGTFSFLHSPDFETAHEPTVGDSIKVHPDGSTKVTKQSKDPKVYHLTTRGLMWKRASSVQRSGKIKWGLIKRNLLGLEPRGIGTIGWIGMV